MKAFLKKVPGLYFLKTKCYEPMRKGYFRYYFLYLRKDKPADINGLTSLGITELKPINFTQWRIGKGKDNAYRRYYTGVFQGTKCFIKIGKNDATVFNECAILGRMCEEALGFSPRLLLGTDTFAENTAMVALEYIEGLKPLSPIGSKADFEDICKQFVSILSSLEQIEIVHGDIHKGNLMLANGKLILMDYGIAKSPNGENSINYLHRPGTFYRESMGTRVYDDAYSFLKMVENMAIPAEYINNRYMQEIIKRVDKVTFSVTYK